MQGSGSEVLYVEPGGYALLQAYGLTVRRLGQVLGCDVYQIKTARASTYPFFFYVSMFSALEVC